MFHNKFHNICFFKSWRIIQTIIEQKNVQTNVILKTVQRELRRLWKQFLFLTTIPSCWNDLCTGVCVCVCTHDWSRKVYPQEYQPTAEEHRCPAKAQSSYNLYHNKSQTSLLDMIQHMNRPWEKPWEIRTVNEWTTACTFRRKWFTWSTRPVGLFRLDSWWMNRWSVHWKKRRSKRWVFN